MPSLILLQRSAPTLNNILRSLLLIHNLVLYLDFKFILVLLKEVRVFLQWMVNSTDHSCLVHIIDSSLCLIF